MAAISDQLYLLSSNFNLLSERCLRAYTPSLEEAIRYSVEGTALGEMEGHRESYQCFFITLSVVDPNMGWFFKI